MPGFEPNTRDLDPKTQGCKPSTSGFGRSSRGSSSSLSLGALIVGALALGVAGCGDSKSPQSPSNPNTPTVAAVAPNSGTTFGGTTVTVTGSKFEAGAIVTIGGSAATDVAVQSPTSLTAKTAQHGAGAADVTVSVGGNTATLRGGFTYVAQSGTTNTPPVISSFKALGTRRNEPQNFADLNEAINVTAFVSDAETPIDQFTYEWSAPAGAFSGSGPAVTWTAPGSGAQQYELTLTVIERYQTADANGLPTSQENRVTGTVKVDVHDSAREVSDMAYDFLVDFSQQRLSPDQIIRNFSGSCRGTDDELGDVQRNQQQKTINTYRVDSPNVNIAFGGTCNDRGRGGDGCAYVGVEWRSTDKASSRAEVARGIDQVAAIYQGNRWYLCSSDFLGTTSSAARPFLGARVVPEP
jgi:hypothetical protein